MHPLLIILVIILIIVFAPTILGLSLLTIGGLLHLLSVYYMPILFYIGLIITSIIFDRLKIKSPFLSYTKYIVGTFIWIITSLIINIDGGYFLSYFFGVISLLYPVISNINKLGQREKENTTEKNIRKAATAILIFYLSFIISTEITSLMNYDWRLETPSILTIYFLIALVFVPIGLFISDLKDFKIRKVDIPIYARLLPLILIEIALGGIAGYLFCRYHIKMYLHLQELVYTNI